MRTKVIEIIGPPGIGKSTIYKSLCKVWRPELNWTYKDKLLSANKPSFKNVILWAEYKAKKFLGKKLVNGKSIDQGLKFINQYPQLADFYWTHLSDDSTSTSMEIDKRFRSAYLLFSDFCTYQEIIDKPGKKPCILNEGLMQKSFLLHQDGYRLQELINTYFSLIPLPQAIIYINTDNKDLVVKRIKNRQKVIATHQGKNDLQLFEDIELWQKCLNVIAAKAKEVNIPVLAVDGEISVKDNTDILLYQLACLENYKEVAYR